MVIIGLLVSVFVLFPTLGNSMSVPVCSLGEGDNQKTFDSGVRIIVEELKFYKLLFLGLFKMRVILRELKNKHFFGLTGNLHFFWNQKLFLRVEIFGLILLGG